MVLREITHSDGFCSSNRALLYSMEAIPVLIPGLALPVPLQDKLSSLSLTGGIGYQLASLTSVTECDVSNNNLGNQIPYSLPPNLTSLNVANNQINGALPDMFGQLSALSTLDISSNSFTGDFSQSFTSLSSATDMYLQNNQFTGTIDVIANLPLKNLKDGNSWNSGLAPHLHLVHLQHLEGVVKIANRGSITLHLLAILVIVGKKSGVGGGAIAGIVISILALLEFNRYNSVFFHRIRLRLLTLKQKGYVPEYANTKKRLQAASCNLHSPR
ncbi:STRUBBELIG-receptor family 7-like protein isoform X2 [Tanacetum coccineum]